MFYLLLLTVSCTLRYSSVRPFLIYILIQKFWRTVKRAAAVWGSVAAQLRSGIKQEGSRAFYSYLQSVLRWGLSTDTVTESKKMNWFSFKQAHHTETKLNSSELTNEFLNVFMTNIWLSKVIQEYTLLLSFIMPVNCPVYLLSSSSSHTTFDNHHNHYLCHSFTVHCTACHRCLLCTSFKSVDL